MIVVLVSILLIGMTDFACSSVSKGQREKDGCVKSGLNKNLPYLVAIE